MTTEPGNNTRKKGLIAMDDVNDLSSTLNPNKPAPTPIPKIEKVKESEAPANNTNPVVVSNTPSTPVSDTDKFKPSRVGKKENSKRRKKENNPLYCMDTNIDPKYLKNGEFKTANLLNPLLKIAKSFAIDNETTMIDLLNVAIYKHLIDVGAIKKKPDLE